MTLRTLTLIACFGLAGCSGGGEATQQDLADASGNAGQANAAAGQAGAAATLPGVGRAGEPNESASGAPDSEAGAGGASETDSLGGAPDETAAGAASGGAASGGAAGASGGASNTAGGASSGGSNTYDPDCVPSNTHPLPAKCNPRPINCTGRVLNFGEQSGTKPGPDPSNGYCTGAFGSCPDDPNVTEPQVCVDAQAGDFSLCSDGRFKSCGAGTCGFVSGACDLRENDNFGTTFCPCVTMGRHVGQSKVPGR